MPTSSEPTRHSTPVLLSAPGLSVVALVLVVLFGSLVVPALFPLQLLDPAWQVRFAGTLISTAAFPLLGLALLQKLQAPMLLSGGVRRSLPHKARSCPQASPTSASTAATSPSLR